MKIANRILLTGLTACWVAVAAQAGELHDGHYMAKAKMSLDDATANLRDEVIGRGLVVDFTGHVGKMLQRTAPTVGATSPFSNAEYIQFCSAKLSHAAVAADPQNIAVCPYVVFAYSLTGAPGQVNIGYRRPKGASGAASQSAINDIEALLRDIVDGAAAN